MLKRELDTYKVFSQAMMRNQAFLQIQNGIDLLIDFINDSYSLYKPEILEKVPEPVIGTPIHDKLVECSDIFDLMKNVSESDIPILFNTLKSNPEVQKHDDKFNLDLVEPVPYSMIVPYVNDVVQLVRDYPLYQDILVSSVSAFEIYCRDTIHDLIASNSNIAKKFEGKVRKNLNIKEKLELHPSTRRLLAHEATQRLSFFNAATVENIFQRCFAKPNMEKYKIHHSKNRKQDLHYYLRLRNLIVHNAGYVDQKFQEETDCKFEIGEIHPVTVENVNELIGLILGIVGRVEEEIKSY